MSAVQFRKIGLRLVCYSIRNNIEAEGSNAAARRIFAYASDPPSIGTTIEQTSRNIEARTGRTTFRTWRSLDICGYFIANQVLSDIDNHEVLIADITRLNFNVLYEIGYAIGKGKPIFAVKNSSLAVEDISLLELGIFDTIGYLEYKNSDELTAALLTQHDVSAIDVPVGRNSRQPIYSIQPKFKTEFVTRIESRINKTKLAQRKFDPIEQARLAAFDAIQQVSESYGVLVPLLASEVQGARLHNLRASFVAGLAEGMGRVRLLLQHGNSPVPIDYRDLATTCYAVSDADAAIAAFAADVTEQLTSQSDIIVSRPEKFCRRLTLAAPPLKTSFETWLAIISKPARISELLAERRESWLAGRVPASPQSFSALEIRFAETKVLWFLD